MSINCESIIKTGVNTGKRCNRYFCKIIGHGQQWRFFNLARHLHMSEYFINVYEQNKNYFDGLNYMKMFKKHLILNKDSKIIARDIKILLQHFQNNFLRDKRAFVMILIYKLLDTRNMNWYLHENKNFKKVVYDKLTQFIELNEYPEITVYLKTTFEINIKYLHIQLNKLHRRKILKKYIRSIIVMYSLYREVIEKRYRPGGVGYYECKERFYKNCIELEKLKKN